MKRLRDRLRELKERRDELAKWLSDPEVANDQQRFVPLTKEYKELEAHETAHEEYEDLLQNLESAERILKEESDEELKEMARQEKEELERKKAELEERIKYLLIPKDPEDDKNAIMEIRAGAGGDEAGLFAGDLYKMYSRYIASKGWSYEVIDQTEGPSGGFKELILRIEGEDVYGILKYESGVHRVQRVPSTESQGRVHTSAASVAVLPEAEDLDVDLEEKDLKKETFRSSGAGGQHVNKTESAVRLTHVPSGLVAESQDSRSQQKNYNSALRHLRSRLYEQEREKQEAEREDQRRSQISSGDRSVKIRTYNFPQGRVTDHRIEFSVHQLEEVLNGELDPFIERLRMAEQHEKLKREGLGDPQEEAS
jgi:peptide chain release factor 1